MSIARALASPRRTGAGVQASKKSKFRPEIQGLRSLAVLMVVSYHVWFGRVSGGVDVFLLISAFLMTLQFVGRYEQGSPMALAKHWLHLFRRLLPAAATVIVATLAASLLFLPRTRWLDVIAQGWASLCYVENRLLQAQATDYYATDHSLASPLQHFWSLSIQGQVFILWPLIFAGAAVLAKRYKLQYRTLLSYIFALVFLVSLTYSIIFTATNQGQAYFDTGARLWEFALGTLVALILPGLRIPRTGRIVLGWLGIVAMLSCGILLNVQAAFPGVAALWPTLAAACIIAAGQTDSRFGVDRILSSRPLVRLGDNSYALYLWHWPVLVISLAWRGRDHAGPVSGTVIIAVALVLAYLTTRFIEKPWREWKWPEVRRRRAAIAVAVAMAIAAFPLTGARVVIQSQANEALAQASRDNPGALSLLPGYVDAAEKDASLLPDITAIKDDWPRLSGACSEQTVSLPEDLTADCSELPAQGTAAQKVMVVGNSHAQHMSTAVKELASQRNWQLVDLISLGCVFGPDAQDPNSDCSAFYQKSMDVVLQNKPDVVFLTATRSEDSSPNEQLVPGFQETVDRLTTAGIKVVGVRDNPRFATNMPECVQTKGQQDPECNPDRASVLPAVSPLDGFRPNDAMFTGIDMTDLLCPEGKCPAVIGNVYVYIDNNHVSQTYWKTLTPEFLRRLEAWPGWKGA